MNHQLASLGKNVPGALVGKRALAKPGHRVAAQAHIDGEWVGKSCSFSGEGAIQPLPERYVPPEYGQWGIEVKDWGTQSSFKLENPDGTMLGLTKFMLPTVGCEADAASYTEDRQEWGVNGKDSTYSCSAEGHWCIAPCQLPSSSGSFLCEASFLVKPDTRHRVSFHFNRWIADKPFKLSKVDVFLETYGGEYNGGRVLPMCCGPESGFSGDEPVDAQRAASVLQSARKSLGPAAEELQAPDDGEKLHPLPLDLAFRCSSDGNDVRVECVYAPETEGSAAATCIVFRKGQLETASADAVTPVQSTSS